MDTVLRATVATASATFYSDGAIVDPGAVTVDVTRDDGTVIVTDGGTSGSGAAARSYALGEAITAQLDILRLDWDSPTYGVITTYVEVVGGHVCSLADIDTILNRGGSAAAYSTALKVQARQVATEAFEAECGVAFTPRYKRDRFAGVGGPALMFPTPQLRAVRSVSVDGSALSQADLDLLDVNSGSGIVYRDAGWSASTRTRGLSVAWEHGYDFPPAYVTRAVALIAASILADGPWDDRGFAVTDDGGSVRLLTAGVQGAAFSIPEVQAAVARSRYPSIA